VYFTTVGQGIGGQQQFFKLDTNTGKITNYEIEGPGVNGDMYLRTLISSDSSRVFFNDEGQVFYIDTATDQAVEATLDATCCYGDYDLTLSADQAQFEATSYLYDYNLNAESYYALNDREILSIEYVYGAKLSADGVLLFQPSTNGIDVLDGRLGNLLNRIALSVSLSQNYDALVSDGRDNVLIAITGTSGDGIAVIDLSSIQEPPPLPYARKHSGSRPVDSPSHARLGSEPLSSRKEHRDLPSHRIPHVTKLSSEGAGKYR
jgi:hypothetical protein